MTEKEDGAKPLPAPLTVPVPPAPPKPSAVPAPAPVPVPVPAPPPPAPVPVPAPVPAPVPLPAAVPPLPIWATNLRDQIALAVLTGIVVREGPSPFSRDTLADLWQRRGTLCYQIADIVLKAR